MQNVCLQMGLRLVTKGGLRISRLQRFVLRCEACSTITQDTSKLFCPACGHATLSRVEVTVGPDGANVYGIRKKHVLKGTRYATVLTFLRHVSSSTRTALPSVVDKTFSESKHSKKVFIFFRSFGRLKFEHLNV